MVNSLKIIVLFSFVGLALFSSGCSFFDKIETSNIETEVNAASIVIPERVVNLSGLSSSEYIDDIIDAGGSHVLSASLDGTDILMQLTPSDISWWKQRTEYYLNDIIERFAALRDGCSIVISNDYMRIELSYWYDMSADDINSLATAAEYWCAMWQLFDKHDGEWFVEMAVYNASNGLLVAEGCYGSEVIGEGLYYNSEDWERSDAE